VIETPLRPSAYLCDLCVERAINAEIAEIRRGPQREELRFERVMCGQWKQITIALFLCSLSAIAVNAQKQQPTPTPKVTGHTITLDDGYVFQVDEYWKQGDEVWYRKGNITQRISQHVKSFKPIYEQPKPEPPEATKTAKIVASQPAKPANQPIWIHLVDGAKFRTAPGTTGITSRFSWPKNG